MLICIYILTSPLDGIIYTYIHTLYTHTSLFDRDSVITHSYRPCGCGALLALSIAAGKAKGSLNKDCDKKFEVVYKYKKGLGGKGEDGFAEVVLVFIRLVIV